MRPLLCDESLAGRSRSSSNDNDITPLGHRSQPPQMTYFLADEKTMEASLSRSDSEERLRAARHNFKKNLGLQLSRTAEEELESPESPLQMSRPFTPLSFGSPAPRSIMSNPDSRRGSDVGSYTLDDVASQAVVSSGEDEGDPADSMVDSGSAPQLVMPSIRMPSRRPFTEKGKNMGRFKVLIAGDSGAYHYVAMEVYRIARLTNYRRWKDISHQSHRADLRGHRPRRSTHRHYVRASRASPAVKDKVEK